MVIFPENRPIFGGKVITKFFWPHKSMVVFEKNTTFFAKKGDFWLQISIGISARNRWNSTEKTQKSMGFLWKIERFFKKSDFWSCRNQWWFLLQIDEIQPKSKKIGRRNQLRFLPKIEQFFKKNGFLSCRNQWWFLLQIDEIQPKNQKILRRSQWVFLQKKEQFFKKEVFFVCRNQWFSMLKIAKNHRKFDFSKLMSVWP